MSKNQRRGNREAKKPKKDKCAAAPVAAGGLWATVEKLKAQDHDKK
ncbi:hypothetical protein [Methylocystis bryophila]|nr:hypothetical protein [Methylocystis bryophila]BDV38220.1 hypothetical protein DSM21852_14730 [Methylocystis bryophila]